MDYLIIYLIDCSIICLINYLMKKSSSQAFASHAGPALGPGLKAGPNAREEML